MNSNRPAVSLAGPGKFLQSPEVWYLLSDSRAMSRVFNRLAPVFYGLVVTVAQVVIAVCLLAPEGPQRYRTLIQHDSYWFMNIVDRGYQTTVPPINHKVMEVSNVGFFPAYPAVVSVLHSVFGIETHEALLLAAQLAAWGFWAYFFLFCQRWKVSPSLQFFGALAIVAHPAAFFLVAGYSESLFLMALLGFIYWSGAEGRSAKILAALHGMVMSATRIVGIPCASYPVVQRIFEKGWSGLNKPKEWLRTYGPAVGLMVAAIAGAISFFVYCQLRWGRWDMYMLTQSICWAIEPDYLAALLPSTYHWLLPALNNPTEISQMATTLGALLAGAVLLCEGIPGLRQRMNRSVRLAIYVCAGIILYISISGVACVRLESMVRYEFCAHALIVLAFVNFLCQFRAPSLWLRSLGTAAAIVVLALSLCLQAWCLWNFTRGNWVA